MPGLFRSVAPTLEQRQANDRHRPGVVLAVLLVLACYAYCFTHLSERLHLPRPARVAARCGLSSDRVFDGDGYVVSNLRIVKTRRFGDDADALLAFFTILAGAFLSFYFLPLAYKQPSLAAWSVAAMTWLYGPVPAAALMTAHLIVYLVLHPDNPWSSAVGAAAGVAAYIAFLHSRVSHEVFGASAAAGGFYAGYRWVVVPLLRRPAFASWMRRLVVHSAILTVCAGAVLNGFGMSEWSLPLGIVLFFWQWQRVWLYYMDYQEGQVPKDLPVHRYLAVFWTPAVIPNWYWGVATAQGYAYVNNNFLCEDKNATVLSGVRIWSVALLYLALGRWMHHEIVHGISSLGLDVHDGVTRSMVADFMEGRGISLPSVWVTTLLSVVEYIFYAAGILHFKVGVWRVCGYRVDPEFDRPWLSTNLAVFWSRFMFHYRAFLVRAFYYPVFFKRLKNHPNARLFAAVLAAATFGNWIWGHLTERLYGHGITSETLLYEFERFPYFVFLGSAIAVSQWFLLRKTRARRPWTWDRWMWSDVLAAYATMQYYALILIFARPAADSAVSDLFRLFGIGLGLGKWVGPQP